MTIDITKAVKSANLKKKDVIGACAGHFIIDSPDSVIEYDNNQEETKVSYVSRHPEGAACRSNIVHKRGLKIGNEHFTYDDGHDFLDYFFITNPRSLGAHGVKITHNDQNYFFTSGPLSGCACAFLYKNGKMYFVHSGGKCDNTEKFLRQKMKLGDMLHCILTLMDEDIAEVPKQITIDELLSYLRDLGLRGTVVFWGEFFQIRGVQEDVITLQYTNKYKNNVGQWSLIVAVNKSGKYSVGVRTHYSLIDDSSSKVFESWCISVIDY